MARRRSKTHADFSKKAAPERKASVTKYRRLDENQQVVVALTYSKSWPRLAVVGSSDQQTQDGETVRLRWRFPSLGVT